MVDLSSSFSVATFTRPAIIAVQWITGVWSWDIQISREPGGGWLNNLPTSNFWRLSGRDMNDDHCLDGWVMLNSWIMNLLQSVYRYWGIFSGNPTKVTKILEALKKNNSSPRCFTSPNGSPWFSPIPSDPQGLCCICAATMSLGFYGAQVVLGNLGSGEWYTIAVTS